MWGHKSRDQKDLHPPADLQGNPHFYCMEREAGTDTGPERGKEFRCYSGMRLGREEKATPVVQVGAAGREWLPHPPTPKQDFGPMEE